MEKTNNENFKEEAFSLAFDLNNNILKKWEQANNWIADRQLVKMRGADVYDEEVITSIFKLFRMVKFAYLKDAKKECVKIEEYIKDHDCEKVIECFEVLDAWLYKKGVTKFDTRQKHDRKIAEFSNQFKGM